MTVGTVVPVDPNSESLIESLETHHEFPGDYTFKVIGGNPDSFVPSVLKAVTEELQLQSEPVHSLKQTPNGKHISITLTLMVKTPQHVVKVYQRMQTLDDVVMLM